MIIPQPLRVFIGWDSAYVDAYRVARASIIRQSTIPLDVQPIRLRDLIGLHKRPVDPLASTEFTYTRFLTPALAGYRGWALYFDCDFLWLGDVARMIANVDGRHAVYCVPHDHQPTELTKADGKPQTAYPRKNWSSLMLFNCDHPSTRKLTPNAVNFEYGSYLHRMHWAADHEIGALSREWNWLVGVSAPMPGNRSPGAVHFTNGGPWLPNCRNVPFSDSWRAELEITSKVLEPAE